MSLTKKQIRNLAHELAKADADMQNAVAECNKAGMRLEMHFQPVKDALLKAEQRVSEVQQALEDEGKVEARK